MYGNGVVTRCNREKRVVGRDSSSSSRSRHRRGSILEGSRRLSSLPRRHPPLPFISFFLAYPPALRRGSVTSLGECCHRIPGFRGNRYLRASVIMISGKREIRRGKADAGTSWRRRISLYDTACSSLQTARGYSPVITINSRRCGTRTVPPGEN